MAANTTIEDVLWGLEHCPEQRVFETAARVLVAKGVLDPQKVVEVLEKDPFRALEDIRVYRGDYPGYEKDGIADANEVLVELGHKPVIVGYGADSPLVQELYLTGRDRIIQNLVNGGEVTDSHWIQKNDVRWRGVIPRPAVGQLWELNKEVLRIIRVSERKAQHPSCAPDVDYDYVVAVPGRHGLHKGGKVYVDNGWPPEGNLIGGPGAPWTNNVRGRSQLVPDEDSLNLVEMNGWKFYKRGS